MCVVLYLLQFKNRHIIREIHNMMDVRACNIYTSIKVYQISLWIANINENKMEICEISREKN